MKCLKCGSSNPDNAAYCQNCHAYLAEQPGMEYLDAFKALILGLFFTGIFYLVFPMPVVRNEYLLQLFSGRISETIIALILWSLFLILFKWRQYRQQHRAYAAFRNQQLHDSLSKGIYVKNVDERILEISQFMQEQKVKKFQDSVIFRRVRRTLRHLKAIPKKEEITSILNYQAEIDHNRMQSGYTLLNVFIWAIPILGFIGTVFGIGQSIGEFSDFIRSTDGTDLNAQMRSALGGVTSGLSVAFSTTFIALVGVVPVMMLSSSLRKREEDLLLSVEEYCLEDLLPNLHVRPGDEMLDDAVSTHLEQMAEFSENWRQQVSPLLESVQSHSKSLSAQVGGLQPLIQKFSESLFEVKDQINDSPRAESVNSAVSEPEKETQSHENSSSNTQTSK
ncbi:MAG: hypothetical protein MAG581_02438 [Deltaproteobacteria bacterium]|jgi:biopolymer transport protein ExbB/TolQ|nr:hypothetical protein [Deltaproteobacteria bacterium]